MTVLACGERWQTPSEDGDLRMAVEDYLGASSQLVDAILARFRDSGAGRG